MSSTSASAIQRAELALNKGEYQKCIDELVSIESQKSITVKESTEIKMLMITAWMGLGNEQKAISICRLLTKSADNETRQKAKQLLSILQAPTLPRPQNWSICLPDIKPSDYTSHKITSKEYQLKKENPIDHPPTGATRNLQRGFSIVVLVVVILLTVLLSGCVQFSTNIHLPEPNRIKIDWIVKSSSEKLLPWQINFEKSIKEKFPKIKIENTYSGKQNIDVPIISAKEANILLQQATTIAAETAGIKISKPTLSSKEKNRVILIQQELELIVDLSKVPKIPGLEILIKLTPSPHNKTITSYPLIANSNSHRDIVWHLQVGEVNTLKLLDWYWNQIGIGISFIILMFLLTTFLQRLRLQIGFGFPELPP